MGIVGDTNEYFNELGKFIAGIGTFCIILFYMVHRTKPSRGEYGSNIVNLTKTRTGIGILLIITTIILFFSEI